MFGEPSSQQIKREKQAARELRRSRWWQNLIQKASCHYCQAPLKSSEVTMDHVLPLSRGGRSTRGNVVPSCKACNTKKHSQLPTAWQGLV